MKDNKDILNKSSIEAKTLEQIIKTAIEEGVEEEPVKQTIKPYMSEDIQSVLKQMGEYLLEEDDEIAVALELNYEEEEEIPRSYIKEVGFKETISKEALLRQAFKEKHYKILQGKRLSNDIRTKNGHYVGRQGDIITYNMIILAEENGCILKLVMNSH